MGVSRDICGTVKEYQQITFVKEPLEVELSREISLLREQCEKVRKSQYAKIGKLTKMYEELKSEHEAFKAAICRREHD